MGEIDSRVLQLYSEENYLLNDVVGDDAALLVGGTGQRDQAILACDAMLDDDGITDGKKMVEIDKLNSVFKVNGIDILAQSKRLC